MGWLFTKDATKQEIIHDQTKGWETPDRIVKCIDYSLRGNTLWIIFEALFKADFKIERFIVCDLLKYEKGYGWGYKDMDESCGPYYYDCPLKFLKMVPDNGINHINHEWRQKVYAFHEEKKGKKDNLLALKQNYQQAQKTGKVCELSILHCSSVPYVILIGFDRKGFPLGLYEGKTYRVKKSQIGDSKIVDPLG